MRKLFVALFGVTLTACATQLGLQEAADRRVTMFAQVVFAPDYDSRRADHLAKWAEPLRITLKGDVSENDSSFVRKQAEAFADLTGLDIGIVGESKPSNVTIYFATVEQMQAVAGARIENIEELYSALRTAGCKSHYTTDGNHRITSAAVFIRIPEEVTEPLKQTRYRVVNEVEKEDDADTVRRCLAQEMTRILGLVNESDLIQPSIFNTNDQLLQLTALDLKFVRTLYAPELKPGMPRRDALRIADSYLQK